MLQEGEYTLETVAGPAATTPRPGCCRGGGFVVLDTAVTPELEAEGVARDLVRAVQQARRDAGLDVSDRIALTIAGPPVRTPPARTAADRRETLAHDVRRRRGRRGDAGDAEPRSRCATSSGAADPRRWRAGRVPGHCPMASSSSARPRGRLVGWAPCDLDLTADAVALTEQLVDIESVSRNEQAIADAVEAALRAAAATSTVTRHGNTVVARTDLGRGERVVIAGHLDTVPLNDNLPARTRRRPACTASAPAT